MDSLVTRYPYGPRVLVCGGADYADRTQVLFELEELKPSVVIHETAPVGAIGAASLAAVWCRVEGVHEHLRRFEFTDRRALREAGCAVDLILAFPGADKNTVVELAERFVAPIKEVAPYTRVVHCKRHPYNVCQLPRPEGRSLEVRVEELG